MEAQTKINTGVILSILAMWTYVGVIDLNPNYYCESRELTAHCYSLSSTNKTCYTLPSNQGGKRCTEGWRSFSATITNDPNQHIYEQSSVEGTQWKCSADPYGCIKIK